MADPLASNAPNDALAPGAATTGDPVMLDLLAKMIMAYHSDLAERLAASSA
jgi:hypothetical protein